MGLFSTWTSITDKEERAKKAKELREARKRIQADYNKRIEPYTAEKVVEDSKKAFEGKIVTGEGKDRKVKTVKDIQEKAKFKRGEALNIRNQEYELIQDKPVKKSKFLEEQLKKTEEQIRRNEAKANKIRIKNKVANALKSKEAKIGYGVVAAAGLALLVTTIAAAGFSIPEIIKAILSAIGQLGEALANMIVGFITTIAEHGPQLVEAVSQIIANILLSIQQNVPLIVETLLSTLTQILEQFAQYVPRMAEAGLQIIGGFLQAIANNLPQILESAITIAVEFIKGIAEKLPEIIDAAFKLIIGFIDGLASAIEENHMALFEAIGHLIKAIVEAIIDGIGMVADAGGKLIFGEDGNGGLVGAIGGFFKDLFDAGANLVKGFIDGILSMPEQLWNAACNVAQSAWDAITHTLDEHSPSRVTFDGGQNFTQGFIDGMGSLDDEVRAASAGVAYSALEALEEEMGEEELYSPRIRPVIDTEELEAEGYGSSNGRNSLPNSNSINGTLYNKNVKTRDDMQKMISSMNKDKITAQDLTKIMNNRSEQEFGIEEFSKMKVVLDSGALVGQLAPAIDQEMGTRQILAGRGVL